MQCYINFNVIFLADLQWDPSALFTTSATLPGSPWCEQTGVSWIHYGGAEGTFITENPDPR